MKNASAVFGDYGQFSKSNNIHLGKPYYYPSDNKDLDENSKKIGLAQKYFDPPQEDGKTVLTSIGGENRNVVGGTPESLESLISYIEDTSGSSKYNESWPATEQSFTSKLPDESTSCVSNVSNKEHSIEDYLEKHGENKEKHGTLSKYVQRFREQPPLSRSQRYSQKKTEEFWWLKSPAQITSSTLSSSDSSNLSVEPNSISFSPTVSEKSSTSAVTRDNQKSLTPRLFSDEDSDSAAARMQFRTDKLLELSENAVKNTTSSTSVKSQRSLPLKYKDVVSAKKENGRLRETLFNDSNENRGSPADIHVSKPLKREDDILYKWRLSRKMDLAAKTASANPFLEVKKYISSEPMEGEPVHKARGIVEKDRRYTNGNMKIASTEGMPGHKTEGIIEKDKEYTNENVKVISKQEHDGTGISNDNTCAKNTYDTNMSTNVCCRKEAIQSSNTCSECKSTLSKCPSVKQHVNCNSCNDLSCLCCKKFNNDQIQCNCNKPSHLSQCNAYYYHVQPRVHGCDMMPCIHQDHSNRHRQQDNEQTLLENKSNLFEKKPGEHHGEHGKRKKTEDTTTSSSKNIVTPVIQQVISHHLFDANSIVSSNESTEVDLEPVQSETERNNLKIPPVEASSDEDEFPDDEILRELRNRRRSNKKELTMVCQQLKRILEQRTEAS